MPAQRIQIENLSKSFRSLRGPIAVLDQVHLAIDPGEFFVLLGPSGCGKSTLLNLIAGLEQPSAGRIRLGERIVVDVDQGINLGPQARDLAMVFQSYALYPHMTIAENLAFPLTNRKPRPSRSEIERRVAETAARLRIATLLDRRPIELSGGQRQRVAMGRALVRQPQVLLMDEPLSNLDARLRVALRAQLNELQRSLGITTVYVTHDQVEAMTLGDRIAVLHDGRIQQCAPPLEVYDHPANAFVARFVGSPPMNLLNGRLRGDAGALAFELGETRIALPPALITEWPHGEVRLGIRPEHIDVVDAGALAASVHLVECLGSTYLIHAELCDQELLIVSARSVDPGRIHVRFAPDRLRLFPAEPRDSRMVAAAGPPWG